jgi:2-polyprenyl-6-hydroxyphenyl methylase/3-demethylubiquinone-9 3-methyltransferase
MNHLNTTTQQRKKDMKKTLKWNIAQRIELLWWKRYLKEKDADEYRTWKKQYWEEVLETIRTALPIQPGMSVLDAGCGPAGIFMNLEHCAVDAVDPLINSYERDLPHFRRDLYPFVNFHNTPVEEFVSPKQYDIVFSTNAINHVSDIDRSYSVLSGMVKPGGALVITVDAHNYTFFKHLFRLIPGDILHPHQYDADEYSAFFPADKYSLMLKKSLRREFFFSHYVLVGRNRG